MFACPVCLFWEIAGCVSALIECLFLPSAYLYFPLIFFAYKRTGKERASFMFLALSLALFAFSYFVVKSGKIGEPANPPFPTIQERPQRTSDTFAPGGLFVGKHRVPQKYYFFPGVQKMLQLLSMF